jgi:hypothetical protein
MNQRGQYGASNAYGYSWTGAETRTPVRKELLLATLEKLRKERRAILDKIKESEARLKWTLDQQGTFQQPITDDIRRLQFESLQRASSDHANEAVQLKKSLAYVNTQIQELSERLAKAMPVPPEQPTAPPPIVKPPPRDPRPRPRPREEPKPPHETRMEPLPDWAQKSAEPAREDKWGSLKTGAYVAGATIVAGLLIYAVARPR